MPGRPKIGEREVCLDLLTTAVETALLAANTTILTDKGLAGREIETQIAELDVQMLRPDRRDLAQLASDAPDKHNFTAYDH